MRPRRCWGSTARRFTRKSRNIIFRRKPANRPGRHVFGMKLALAERYARSRMGREVARAETPDLLLTDIRMPGMTGLEAARQIVAEAPDVSVVVMTGFSEFDNLLETVKLGVNGFLMKPFTPDDLRKTVEEGLRKGLYFKRNTRLRALQPLLYLHSNRLGDVDQGRVFQIITEAVLHELNAERVTLVTLDDD